MQRRIRRERPACGPAPCECVQLRPLIRRKKLDRGEHLRPFIGPSCSFTGASNLGLSVTLPLSSLISITPANPHDVPPPLRLLNDSHDVSSATYLAQPSSHRPAPKRHRELRPRRFSRAGRLVSQSGLVAPARCELLSMPIAVALDRSSVAGEAMPAAGPRRPAAGLRAANPAQRKKSGKPDFFEVVELVERPERHASCVPGAVGGVLSHTLTSCACLRRFPSQAREPPQLSTEEDGAETAVDGSQVSPAARNGPGGHALAAIEPLEGGGAALAELARAVEHDLATQDHAPATERAYAHYWADFAAFCGGHGLAPLPAAPQTLALYLKALETQRTRSPAGLAAGTVGLSLPTLRRRLAAIASRHATAGLEAPTEHSLVRRLLRRYSRAPRHGRAEEGAAPHRAAAGDSDGHAGQRARDARSGAAAARLCWGVPAERARGARCRAAAVLASRVLRLDRKRQERPAEEGPRALCAALANDVGEGSSMSRGGARARREPKPCRARPARWPFDVVPRDRMSDECREFCLPAGTGPLLERSHKKCSAGHVDFLGVPLDA